MGKVGEEEKAFVNGVHLDFGCVFQGDGCDSSGDVRIERVVAGEDGDVLRVAERLHFEKWIATFESERLRFFCECHDDAVVVTQNDNWFVREVWAEPPLAAGKEAVAVCVENHGLLHMHSSACHASLSVSAGEFLLPIVL